MSKTLFLDCSMGAAGDMIAAALIGLFDDPGAILAALNSMGIPHTTFAIKHVRKCGIAATHLAVRVHGEEECAGDIAHESAPHHGHGGDHGHGHHHAHSGLADIFATIDGLALPAKVAGEAREIYRLLADAEAHVHGGSPDSIHFHEVGSLDAIADIAAVALMVNALSPDEIVATPVNTGMGSVRCAHGILPVPAPCTARLLEGMPAYSDGITEGELCTPTGAALLKHYVARFGQMPGMTISRCGVGAGMKDFEKANILRAFIGSGATREAAPESGETARRDEVCEFRCSIDDMTAEEFAFAAQRLMEAGALDVCMVPALMKKGRPGTILEVLCRVADRDAIARHIFKNTTTIGIRETIVGRRILLRREETVETPLGAVRRKISSGEGVLRVKSDYDDVAGIASRQAD